MSTARILSVVVHGGFAVDACNSFAPRTEGAVRFLNREIYSLKNDPAIDSFFQLSYSHFLSVPLISDT